MSQARYFTLAVAVEDNERDGNGAIHEVRMTEDSKESELPVEEPPENDELLAFANRHLPDRLEATEVLEFAH